MHNNNVKKLAVTTFKQLNHGSLINHSVNFAIAIAAALIK